jgi:hypothetical protein
MRRAAVALALVAALLLASAVLARGPELLAQVGSYDLSWWTADTGGGATGGGEYILSSTAGQHDAAPPVSQGAYTLSAGFWSGTRIEYRVNLPLALWSNP